MFVKFDSNLFVINMICDIEDLKLFLVFIYFMFFIFIFMVKII